MCPTELNVKAKLEWLNGHKMRWVNRVEVGVSVKLVAVVVSVLMTGSCEALPTPTLAPLFTSLPEHALETPRREVRVCCEDPSSAASPVVTSEAGVMAGLRPGNVEVVRRSPTSVLVTWSSPAALHPLKYEITYKPTNAKYRVVAEVVEPQRSVVLERLLPHTEYQVFVTSVHNSTALHTSSTYTFLTSTQATRDNDTGHVISKLSVSEGSGIGEESGVGVLDRALGQVRVRAEEVGIVLLVLAVWMFAIVLFFNRWGKIRMLEPYQEPYKESPPSQHRLSCPKTDPCTLPFSPMKRGSLSYSQAEHHHHYHQAGARRKRQNSVFVDRTRSHSFLEVHPPRRVKSALNLTTLVLQESEEEGATATTFT